MAQDYRRWEEEQGRPNGARGGDRNARRFGGEMEDDRNDGGFLPVDDADQRGEAYDRGRESRSYGNERYNPDQDPLRGDAASWRGWERWQDDRRLASEMGRGAPPARAGRWDGRDRWRQGEEQGGRFARDRDFGDRHMEYGDEDYGRYGMQSGGRWPDEQRMERHSGPEHREYRAWREEQMRRCDEEYGEYCRERQEKFNQDFENWRQSRSARRGSRVEIGDTGAASLSSESPTSVRGPSNDTISK